MDTMPSRVKGWWWLDADRVWRWTLLRVWAAWRARQARRVERGDWLRARGFVGGRWR